MFNTSKVNIGGCSVLKQIVLRSRPLGFALSFGVATLIVLLISACSNSFAPAQSVPTATSVPAEVVARGAQLYATNCQACHGDAKGNGKLPYVPSHGSDGHTWHHSDRNLTEIIMNGGDEMTAMMRQMSGTPEDAPRMPVWRAVLSEEDIKAILAFIKTFWTPEQRRMQEQSPMMR